MRSMLFAVVAASSMSTAAFAGGFDASGIAAFGGGIMQGYQQGQMQQLESQRRGTAGYNNGGGSEARREQDAQIRAANDAKAAAIGQDCKGQMANHDLDPIRDKVEIARALV